MKIIAIGGGSMIEGATDSIDRSVVSFTGKKNPTALFIPTASSDDLTYVSNFEKVYGLKLGCKTHSLLLLDPHITQKEIRKKILQSDIIYVGGGNTLKLMRRWRFLGVDQLLKQATKNNTVLAGSSAGALCWASFGHSDSMAYYHPQKWDYIKVKCLGFVPLLICPHYLKENRDESFKAMVKKTGGWAVALDDCSAMQIENDRVKFIQSKPTAFAFRLEKVKSNVQEIKLPVNQWIPFSNLKSGQI